MVSPGERIAVRVTPNAACAALEQTGDAAFRARVTAPADKNKANEALVKLFRKKLGVRVRIVAGARSKEKVVEAY